MNNRQTNRSIVDPTIDSGASIVMNNSTKLQLDQTSHDPPNRILLILAQQAKLTLANE